jgi:hypothetical protein
VPRNGKLTAEQEEDIIAALTKKPHAMQVAHDNGWSFVTMWRRAAGAGIELTAGREAKREGISGCRPNSEVMGFTRLARCAHSPNVLCPHLQHRRERSPGSALFSDILLLEPTSLTCVGLIEAGSYGKITMEEPLRLAAPADSQHYRKLADKHRNIAGQCQSAKARQRILDLASCLLV